MADSAATTLLVDDEVDMRLLVRLICEMSGPDVEIVAEASDGIEALEEYRRLGHPNPKVVILDNRMPRMTGLEAAAEILRENPSQIVILYSAHLDDSVRAIAKEMGIAHCLSKEQLEQIPAVISDLITG